VLAKGEMVPLQLIEVFGGIYVFERPAVGERD
jgi:hypothetical protein